MVNEALIDWVMQPRSLSELMRCPVEDDVMRTYPARARRLHPRLHVMGVPARSAVLALRCGGEVRHVLAGMRTSGLEQLEAEPGAWEEFVRLCSDQGTTWVRRLLAAAGMGDLESHPLLARLVADHGLDQPAWFRLARLGRPEGVGAVGGPEDQEPWYRHLLGALQELGSQARTESTEALIASLTSHDGWRPWNLGRWAVVLLIRLGATAEQVLWWLREWPVIDGNGSNPTFRGEFLAAVAERGQGFAAEVVALAASDPLVLRGGVDLAELLIVHCDLPLPESRAFWECWLGECAIPARGQRWQEHFLAACAVRDILAPFSDPEVHMERVATGIAELRAVNEVDDAALTDALLAVWERGDRISSQRSVVQWLGALGLMDRLWAERPRLLAVLPMLEGAAWTFVVELVLAGQFSDAELVELAAIVLPRGPRALARKVIRVLERLDEAPQELQESVALLEQDPHAPTARRARGLMESWQGSGDSDQEGVDVLAPESRS